MKLFAIYIQNNIIQHYGRAARQACRPVVLFLLLAYDEMGRISRYYTERGYTTVQDKTYIYGTYTNNGVTYATNQLVRIEDNTYKGADSTATYNANGYVSGIGYHGNTYTYEYDALGRLTAEKVNGVLVESYTYDNKNNIQKTGLTYTDGKLTSVNGARIEYDNMGNPIVYKGNTFVWEQGRKLVSGSMNGNSFSYSYDGNGMRYKKTVNGAKTEYYWNGNQLLYENRNNGVGRIYYAYDMNGISGMICEGKSYYYDKNTLGDIIAIRDESGNIVATYEYDAWGNITYQYGTMAEINPFRYRGYYYDTETGFYYLQTRYYDPTICRFINADDYELVAELSSVAGQLNMYAYCGNNPVMYTDETGCFWSAIGDWFSENWIQVLVGTTFILGGAIVSALTCGVGTNAWMAFGSALLSSAVQVSTSIAVSVGVNGLINVANGNHFFDDIGSTIANAYMWSGIFSGGSQIVSGGFRVLKKNNFSGISNSQIGFLSPDKLFYAQPGMTIIRFGNPKGLRVALDFGKYGIHAHLFGKRHIWMIPGLVGLLEYFN